MKITKKNTKKYKQTKISNDLKILTNSENSKNLKKVQKISKSFEKYKYILKNPKKIQKCSQAVKKSKNLEKYETFGNIFFVKKNIFFLVLPMEEIGF